jgi:hypothetical protein
MDAVPLMYPGPVSASAMRFIMIEQNHYLVEVLQQIQYPALHLIF